MNAHCMLTWGSLHVTVNTRYVIRTWCKAMWIYCPDWSAIGMTNVPIYIYCWGINLVDSWWEVTNNCTCKHSFRKLPTHYALLFTGLEEEAMWMYGQHRYMLQIFTNNNVNCTGPLSLWTQSSRNQCYTYPI